MGCSKSSATKDIYGGKHIKQQGRFQANNLTLHLKEPEEDWTKSKVSRKKENNKD